MKKEYKIPTIESTLFDDESVVTVSGTNTNMVEEALQTSLSESGTAGTIAKVKFTF